MRRREFICLLSGVAGWPFCATAQHDPKRRIGVLMNRPESDLNAQASATVFKELIAKLGWIDGKTAQIDFRWAAEAKALQTAAAELVSFKSDVILASATDGLTASRMATSTIPIVFVSVSDPVGQGFVSSLARPGGHITGFTAFEFSIGGKWLQILKEIAPSIQRVAIIFNPTTAPYFAAFVRPIEAAAGPLGLETVSAPVRNVSDIENAILEALGREPKGGLVLPSDAFTSINRAQIIALAARYRLPAIYAFRFFPTDGGLISYGVDRVNFYRQAAPYIDRILRGEKPGDLPIQQPTKFELVINLKTAKALDLVVPPALLARADEVIE